MVAEGAGAGSPFPTAEPASKHRNRDKAAVTFPRGKDKERRHFLCGGTGLHSVTWQGRSYMLGQAFMTRLTTAETRLAGTGLRFGDQPEQGAEPEPPLRPPPANSAGGMVAPAAQRESQALELALRIRCFQNCLLKLF